MIAPNRTRLSWLFLVFELGLLAFVVVLLWPTSAALLREWLDTESTTYTHGLLIVLVTLWLLARDREVLVRASKPSWIAAIILAVLGFLWLIAVRAAIQIAHEILLPLIAWFALAAAFGFSAANRRAFAISYLFFAIPIWAFVNPALQALTVQVSRVLLSATGIPAFVDGNFVHLASGAFEIAGGCSGLHYVIVGLALSALYGEVNRDPIRVRIKLLLLALGLSLLANWVRVYTIILAGYLTDMQHYLVRVSHYNFGWAIFAGSMVVFFLIARRMPIAEKHVLEVGAGETALCDRSKSLGRGIASSMTALSLGAVWNLAVPIAPAAISEPQSVARATGWRQVESISNAIWQPQYAAADRLRFEQFERDAKIVSVFTAEYSMQRQGHELISSDNRLLPAEQRVTRARVLTNPHRVNEVEVSTKTSAYLVWYSYRVGTRRFTNETAAQIWYGLISLAGPVGSSLQAWQTECVPNCDEARSILSRFANDL